MFRIDVQIANLRKRFLFHTASMATAKKATKRVQVAYEEEGESASGVGKRIKAQNEECFNNLLLAATKKNKLFEPDDWRQVLENIRLMRIDHAAPVDSMGCEKCHEGLCQDIKFTHNQITKFFFRRNRWWKDKKIPDFSLVDALSND